MPKRKKIAENTPVVFEEDDKPKEVTLADYFIPQKITAFCDAYDPSREQTMRSEVFTEGRLREFFKAYVLPEKGDPLQLYLDALAVHGYHMSVTLAGDAAIIVEPSFN